jgi:hypothetical protein
MLAWIGSYCYDLVRPRLAQQRKATANKKHFSCRANAIAMDLCQWKKCLEWQKNGKRTLRMASLVRGGLPLKAFGRCCRLADASGVSLKSWG